MIHAAASRHFHIYFQNSYVVKKDYMVLKCLHGARSAYSMIYNASPQQEILK